MPTQTPLKVLQNARDRVLADSPFNLSAYMVLCSAIGHVIGMRVSSVDRLMLEAICLSLTLSGSKSLLEVK